MQYVTQARDTTMDARVKDNANNTLAIFKNYSK